MRTLLLALLFFASSAFAGTENMVAQCEAVMRCDICRVANDNSEYPNGIPLPVKDASGRFLYTRRISTPAYNWIRNAGDAKVGDRYLMCMRVEEAMSEPVGSEHRLAATSLFDANWAARDYCPFPRK